MSVAEHLIELEAAAAQAAHEVEQVATDRREAQRAVIAARQERVAYFEALGAGERPADPGVESKLREAIAEAEALANDDDLWEGQLAGRRRAAEAREREALEYFGAHFQALSDGWLDEDEQARHGLQQAHRDWIEAEERYAARLAHWRRVAARYDGIDPDDLPHLPTRGEPGEVAQRFSTGIEPPSPRSLVTREVVA